MTAPRSRVDGNTRSSRGTGWGRSAMGAPCSGWCPVRLLTSAVRYNRAMQLRVARHTAQLDSLVAFYRDGLGLREIGGFTDHDGYDGVFLEVPGTGAHLELTSGGAHAAPQPHPESLLVLYLGDNATVRAIAKRLGRAPVAPANPYWAEHGVTFEDPDGFRVVLVPDGWPR